MVLGALGGRTARHARHLAEKLAEEGDAPSPELRAMVGARGPLLASLASFDLLLAIVVLMVWQPGQPEQPSSYRRFELSAKLEGKIVAAHPRFAYIPTRLPRGLRFFTYDSRLPYLELSFFGSGPAGSAFIDYSVSQAQCGMSRKPPDRGTFSVNGYLLGWDRSSGRWSVRRCVKEGNDSLVIEADSLSDRWGRADLATIVAYAAPLN
jgi:hypothetical protein